MRAVIDTNVLISAEISPNGAPAEILRRWNEGRFEIVTSELLLIELARALEYDRVRRYIAQTDSEIVEFKQRLRALAVVVDVEPYLHVLADEADNRVLEAAIAGEADYVVSGDAALLALGGHEGIFVVGPAHFLALLASAPEP